MVADVNENKLDKAYQCSIQSVINPQKQDVSGMILKYFGLNKADLILE